MNKQRSAEGGSSDDDKTFDFKYKFDISDRKGKTGQTFRQEQGYDFDDFKDFREDKSQKSFITTSQRRVLPSQLIKRSQQSFLIQQNQTQISNKVKGGSFIVQGIKKQNSQSIQQINTINRNISPKFSNRKNNQSQINNALSKTINQQYFDKKLFKYSQDSYMQQSLRNKVNHTKRSDSELLPQIIQQIPTSQKYQQLVTSKNEKPISYNVSTSRVKPNLSNRSLPQLEYRELLNSIKYYQNENEKMDYETKKVLEEIEKYEELIENNNEYEQEMRKLMQETNQLNSKITMQRTLEKTLNQHQKKLEEEFDQIVLSIEGLKFQRPSIIKDQTKVIIDKINSLKTQFQHLKREEGSLNLSTTLPNQSPSIEMRIPAIADLKKKNTNQQSIIFKQYVTQIEEISLNYPNYIYNIKMMIMKDEWKIYQNTQLCINCCSRDYPRLQIRIGNKIIKNLIDFVLKQKDKTIIQKQILQGKSYYIHSYQISKIKQPFIKIMISYRIDQKSEQKKYIFFFPVLPLKYGQFIPINKKQYEQQNNQHKNVLQILSSLSKPMDNRIIQQNISQFRLFYPNLLYEVNKQNQYECKGIFKLWNSCQGALVKIRQKRNQISIQIKNYIPYLLESLEFVLTAFI